MSGLISSVAQFFLLSLFGGTYLFSFLVDTSKTGVGFFKLILSIVLSSLVLHFILHVFSHEYNSIQTILYVMSFILVFIQYLFHRDQKSTFMKVCFLLQVICIFVLAFLIYNTSLASFLFFVASLLLVGVVNYEMLLGHYYLVVPRLSEKPLLNSLYLFWIIITVKISISTYTTFSNANYFQEGSLLGDGYIFNMLILSMRYLWGYVALLILSYFAYKLCKMRSIQSATGVFYIMVFFVFVGEILSAYFFEKFGLFI